jgi:hypothetical protein
VVRGGDFIQHPFAVAIFGTHVYWTDWRTNSVHKVGNHWKKKSQVIEKKELLPIYFEIIQNPMNLN